MDNIKVDKLITAAQRKKMLSELKNWAAEAVTQMFDDDVDKIARKWYKENKESIRLLMTESLEKEVAEEVKKATKHFMSTTFKTYRY